MHLSTNIHRFVTKNLYNADVAFVFTMSSATRTNTQTWNFDKNCVVCIIVSDIIFAVYREEILWGTFESFGCASPGNEVNEQLNKEVRR